MKAITLIALAAMVSVQDPEMPRLVDLKASKEPPDPLVFLDGSRVKTKDDWARRRREIREIFRTFMYGHTPPRPENLSHTVDREVTDFLDGKATMREITIRFGPRGCPPIHLLLVTPNAREKSRTLLFVNFRGNHAVTADARVSLSKDWIYSRGTGVVKNRATEKSRGDQARRWPFAYAVDRGYAVATFHNSDIDPDFNDFNNGVHAAYRRLGNYDWGTIAAWAWGLQRALDYLITDPRVEADRIVVNGHSRLGKTALLAGAMDDRFAAVIANESGCGGAAISRGKRGESVKAINDQFPHWFNGTFKSFNQREEYMPFDQHMLAALVAPRPLLISNAEKDSWVDPRAEFRAAKLASPVYTFLGTDGLPADKMPDLDTLVKGRIGYHLRAGGHDVTKADWKAYLDFLDHHWGAPER